MQFSTVIELEEAHENFVMAIAMGMVPTRASKLAGYSIGHTANLLNQSGIRAALLAMSTNCKRALKDAERRRQPKETAVAVTQENQEPMA
jgi:hypothetical protein